jgi:hypothetical protein
MADRSVLCRILRRGYFGSCGVLGTQKVEWGISDKLQISTFVNALHSSNAAGSRAMGTGDFEIGARYTWASVRSRFTHIALAFDAGFPTGDARKGLGEAAYTVAPSSLVSRELPRGQVPDFLNDRR